MFVTNLTNTKLGINGIINLKPREVNRYIDDTDADLVDRICRLESANMVAVVRSKGLEKNGLTVKAGGRAVKTVMGADKGAIGNGPRTPGVEVIAEDVKQPKVKKAKAEKTADTNTEAVETVSSYRRSRKAKAAEATVETATEAVSETTDPTTEG